MAKKKGIKIEIKIDKLLGGFRKPIAKVGGPMKPKKGHGSYDRKKEKTEWREKY